MRLAARFATKGNDLELYERHAGEWWNPRSAPFRSLHSVNEHRLSVLRAWLGGRFDGRVVADLGCGGGLLARPLAEAGARVVGLDLSAASLAQAKARVRGGFLRADALALPLAAHSVDIVLLADVLEHVADRRRVLREAARVLRPGGVAFVNTLNRTWKARVLAVQLAEGVRLIPRGTHDAELFVRPDELARDAWSAGLVLEALQGESVDVLRTLRRWAIALRASGDTSVGYSALLRKRVAS